MVTFPIRASETSQRGSVLIAALVALGIVLTLAMIWAQRASTLEKDIRMSSRETDDPSAALQDYLAENVDCVETLNTQLWFQYPTGGFVTLNKRQDAGAFTPGVYPEQENTGITNLIPAGTDGADLTIGSRTVRTRAKLVSHANDAGVWRYNYEIQTKSSGSWAASTSFSCPKPCTAPVAGIPCIAP